MQYLIAITLIGLAALAMSWMPSITRISRISYSIFYVIFGAALYLALGDYLPTPDPVAQNYFTVHFTELVVIISLIGTGLKIDQAFSLRSWKVPFRMVTITMLLSIIVVALTAHYLLGFNWASSLLIAAVLAPTDPVLASDVQVGPPMEEKENKVRFALTAEAGMNDGTAFPFVWLAIVLAAGPTAADLANWFTFDMVYRLLAGCVLGYLFGRLVSYLTFTLPDSNRSIIVRDGFVAISATFLVYGITEMLMGYGFVAVFVCAVTMRNSETEHRYHKTLHEFTDQIERLLIGIVLMLFGGSLVSGILNALTWQMVLVAVVFLVLIRPLTAFVALPSGSLHLKERIAISFFGIRGMGSFFYLAFALSHGNFLNAGELWALCAFVVLLSVFLHGLSAVTVMNRLEKEFGNPDAK